MTKETMQRALRAAVKEAFRLGHEREGRFGGELLAQKYAESLVMPIHEVCVEEGVEQGFQSARQPAQQAAQAGGT